MTSSVISDAPHTKLTSWGNTASCNVHIRFHQESDRIIFRELTHMDVAGRLVSS